MPAARAAARKSGTAWGCGITGLAPAGAASPMAMAAPAAPTRTLANLSGLILRSVIISIVSLSLWCYDEVVAEVDCSAGLVRAALWAYALGARPIRDSQKKTVITANKAVAMRRRNSCLLYGFSV